MLIFNILGLFHNFLDAKIRILLFSFLMEIVEYEERSRKIE